jgi:DDE superfamily endonuclease
VRQKKGRIATLSTTPPEQRAVIGLDSMGPGAAKSYPGQQLVGAAPAAEPPAPAPRATQEIDDGRRGKGYIFGAFQPATGEALTQDYRGRTINNGVDCLGHVEVGVPAEIERLYAMVDTLHVHRATDVLLFCLQHPRGEFVFQPQYAASLNLMEPWGKTLRSLALKGRRFETWAEGVKAVAEAPVYWNNHRHPYIWGRRRRHRPRRKSGIAALPKAA